MKIENNFAKYIMGTTSSTTIAWQSIGEIVKNFGFIKCETNDSIPTYYKYECKIQEYNDHIIISSYNFYPRMKVNKPAVYNVANYNNISRCIGKYIRYTNNDGSRNACVLAKYLRENATDLKNSSTNQAVNDNINGAEATVYARGTKHIVITEPPRFNTIKSFYVDEKQLDVEQLFILLEKMFPYVEREFYFYNGGMEIAQGVQILLKGAANVNGTICKWDYSLIKSLLNDKANLTLMKSWSRSDGLAFDFLPAD